MHDKCELRSLLSILPATIPSHLIEKYLPTLGNLATVPRLPADVLPVPSWHIFEPLTIKDKCDADSVPPVKGVVSIQCCPYLVALATGSTSSNGTPRRDRTTIFAPCG